MATITVRRGTLCVAGRYFPEGVSELAPEIIESVRAAVDGLPWAVVDEDADPEAVSEPVSEVLGEGDETPEPAIPVPTEALVASDVVDPDAATRAERLKTLVENDGEPPKPSRVGGFACDECDKVLKSEAGLASHKRLKHVAA